MPLSLRAAGTVRIGLKEFREDGTMNQDEKTTRRDFLGTGLAILGTAAALGPARVWAADPEKSANAEMGVTPPEDLMREHGVLRRILHVYEELFRRLTNNRDFDPAVLSSAAGIIKKFIEEYHEKLEEEYIFPRFVQAGKLVDLVNVLKVQHQAGRRVTDYLLANTKAEALKDPEMRQGLADHLRAFWRMYRPHAAREDTVLFVALRTVVSPKEFEEMGDKFEDTEQEKFGKGGFEKIVHEVAGLETTLGIENLAQFTPKV
jgi:hemerythrin-like domain-containing protein